MKFTRFSFKSEAVWILIFTAGPLIIGLLLALVIPWLAR